MRFSPLNSRCLWAGLLCGVVFGDDGKTGPARAPLPASSALRSDVFFDNAFLEGLIGTRPTQLGGERAGGAKAAAVAQEPTSPASTGGWASIISAETLEDEVKALAIQAGSIVTTPSRFSSGGYQDVRRVYSELAVLFAVIAEFDGNVRWAKEAPTARERFARAAANAKVTSIQAFNEAKQRKLDLQELVRGGAVPVSEAADKRANWEHVCDRGPMMERFTNAYEEGLAVWTSTPAIFKTNGKKIRHEAELLKMFAVVLAKAGMPDAEDDDYLNYCRQLAEAADGVLQAVRDDDAATARQAASEVGKSCVSCHDDYRA